MRRAIWLVVLVVFAAGMWWWQPWAQKSRAEETIAGLSVATALSGGDDAGFAHADSPRAFVFPADHGPHPEFRSEWWYYTGNLATADQRRFGYQLTIFRIALSPPTVVPDQESPRASAWATRQVYFAHLALSDIADHRFMSRELTQRDALALAGSNADPFRVWIDQWSAEGWAPTQVRAQSDAFSIALTLMPGKPVVLEGQQGLSHKGPGAASYYYSFTRMPTQGEITFSADNRSSKKTFQVSGESWMDREWSTSALSAGQNGWDWFALQLDDGREIMFYRMRRDDDTIDHFSSGTLIERDGTSRQLALADVQISSDETWTSPRSHARYPARWHVIVPSANIDVSVRPLLADQELDVGFRYWEGAVEMSGSSTGHGYVELTGYDDHPLAPKP